MKSILETFTSRKFLFTLLVMGVALSVDMYTARGLSDNFKQVLIYLVGIYTAGNVGSKLSYAYENKGSANSDGDPAPISLPDTSSKDLDEVKKTLEEINNVLSSVVTSSDTANKGLSFIIDKINGANQPKG